MKFLDNFPGYALQTFDDKAKDRGLARTFYGKNSKGLETVTKLKELNSSTAGVFFTPNSFPVRRLATMCEGVNAWIVECDTKTKEEQLKELKICELEPSILVETRSSIHAYWLSDGGTIENYGAIVRGLIDKFDGDTACKDISRVFRMPGFYHHKKDPYKIKLIKADYDLKYTEEQMLKVFPEPVKEVAVTNTKQPVVESPFWYEVNKLDCKQALCRLSGTGMVNGESYTFRARSGGGEYIDIDGEPADCWIDSSGMIGSGKDAGPSIVNWLMYYSHSKADIAKWVKDRCRGLISDDVLDGKKAEVVPVMETETEKDEDDFDELTQGHKPYTWGTKILDQEISPIERGNYLLLVGETASGKTAYAFDVAVKNAGLGHRVLFLTLEMTKEKLYQRCARTYAGITKSEWSTKIIPSHKLDAYKRQKTWVRNIKNLDLVGTSNEITQESLHTYLDKEKDNYDLIFIDNFGFISAGSKEQLRHESETSRMLSNFTSDANLPIVLIHHFKKGKDNKVRSINSIMGSSKFSHDVDNAIQVWRDVIDNPSVTKVIEMKDRGWGMGGSVEIKFNKGTFDDMLQMYMEVI